MARIFKVWPKRTTNRNGIRLSTEMEVTVTTKMPTSNPFYNGAAELKERYMFLYNVDLKKGCFNQNDFEWKALD